MKKDFEGWELTAYAFGELPSDRSQVIESAIAKDPAIAAELAEIRATLATLSSAYQAESDCGLSEHQKRSVVAAISDTSAQSTTLKASGGWTRVQLLGLAATAACFIVAVSLSSWVAFRPGQQLSSAKLEKQKIPASSMRNAAPPTSGSMPNVDRSAIPTDSESAGAAGQEANSSSSKNKLAILPKMKASDMSLSDNSQPLAESEFVEERLGQLSAVNDPAAAQPSSPASSFYNGLPQTTVGGLGRPGLGGGGGDSGASVGSGLGSPYGGSFGNEGKNLYAETAPSVYGRALSGEESEVRLRTLATKESELDLVAQLSDRMDAIDDLAEESKFNSVLSRQSVAMPGGDRFAAVVDNPFRLVRQDPLSTFSIDVDTASYSKVRQYLMELGQLPPPDSVRIEELLNYFHYDYAGPTDDQPFASSLAVARCPWNADHRLVRVALQAKKIEVEKRPLSNLVFLLDVSGSMNEPNKLPLVQQALRMLISNLGENDRVAMVVYAGAAGMVLDSTLGTEQSAIMTALDRLTAGGSTNGGEGIQLAYQIAREHFITGGTNRVVLCTDGDFNVGVTGTDELVKVVEENAKSKIFLTVLGFGMGNTNDEMLEKISDRGNGVYGFIDNEMEARKLMIEQLTGSLVTVAKDVKIQVEFNPAKVQGYRLIGYENRILATEDFNNDKKDAGDIGAGHCVTALYEIIPAGDQSEELGASIDDLRYQAGKELKPEAESSNELMIVKMRFKQPDGTTSALQEFPLVDKDQAIQECDRDFRWAASIAQFGMLLRNSPYLGQSNWDALIESAQEAAGEQPDVYRQQALELIKRAAAMVGKQ
jgi:Ca-activated chloride channel homolog